SLSLRFRRLRPQPMHSPVSASRRQRLTQGVSKEVPADYSADYVGIGATRSQKLDIRGGLQGVSAHLKSRHAARTSNSSLPPDQRIWIPRQYRINPDSRTAMSVPPEPSNR